MNTNQGTMTILGDDSEEAKRRATAEGAELWHVGEEIEVKGDRYRVHRITKKTIELRPIKGGRVQPVHAR